MNIPNSRIFKKELESSRATPGCKNGQKRVENAYYVLSTTVTQKRCQYGLNLRQKFERLEQMISDSCLREPQIVLILNSD